MVFTMGRKKRSVEDVDLIYKKENKRKENKIKEILTLVEEIMKS